MLKYLVAIGSARAKSNADGVGEKWAFVCLHDVDAAIVGFPKAL